MVVQRNIRIFYRTYNFGSVEKDRAKDVTEEQQTQSKSATVQNEDTKFIKAISFDCLV